jgi:hypothetical protein
MGGVGENSNQQQAKHEHNDVLHPSTLLSRCFLLLLFNVGIDLALWHCVNGFQQFLLPQLLIPVGLPPAVGVFGSVVVVGVEGVAAPLEDFIVLLVIGFEVVASSVGEGGDMWRIQLAFFLGNAQDILEFASLLPLVLIAGTLHAALDDVAQH